jgi:uncharacterized membrane protein
LKNFSIQKILNGVIVVSLALLIIGVFYIYKMPSNRSADFDPKAADISQTPYSEVLKAKVVAVEEAEATEGKRYSRFLQQFEVEILEGNDSGLKVTIINDENLIDKNKQEVKIGDRIIVGKINNSDELSYVMVDRYRLPWVGGLVLLLITCIAIFAKWRGLISFFGLSVSILILVFFISPNILAGKDPLLVSLVGSGIISMVSMYLAHGFNYKTSISMVSLFISLGFAGGLAYYFVRLQNLLGTGSQDAIFLQMGFVGKLDLQGLLLGGIIIGTLGVLDDVTATQTATVAAIHKARPQSSFRELYKSAESVGREHIASLVNTLAMAYAGAAFPLFLLLTLNTQVPLIYVVNSEFFIEEIIRTLIGSLALILAVPISTVISAWYFSNQSK